MAHPSGRLVFHDGLSERDFVAVSTQDSPIQHLYFELQTTASDYGNGMQVNSALSGSTEPSDPKVILAQLEWTGRQLGRVKLFFTHPAVEQAMPFLCMPGTESGSRYFLLDRDGSGALLPYTWRRASSNYTLSGPSNELLARYDRLQTATPPHAALDFYFEDKLLLLTALISLTLNRWLDGPNSPLLLSVGQ